MQSAELAHIPVMLTEVVDALLPALTKAAAPVLVDATLGLGGHASALLAACPEARLIGIDRDGQALSVAAQRLAQFQDRVSLVRARFDTLPDVLDDLRLDRVTAVLFDLGVSSLQIDDPARGFSYSKDAPLDMRMDDRLALDAAVIVNTWPGVELARLMTDFGEEPHALRVAQAIVTAREIAPIESTGRLANVIMEAMPAAVRYGSGGHPAKRVFQALRIAVNGELEALAAGLPSACMRLAVDGRIAVLAYHSLEDRIVKQTFTRLSRDNAPRRLPVVPDGLAPQFRRVSRAQRPTETEIAQNPRAASARLRVATRIKEA